MCLPRCSRCKQRCIKVQWIKHLDTLDSNDDVALVQIHVRDLVFMILRYRIDQGDAYACRVCKIDGRAKSVAENDAIDEFHHYRVSVSACERVFDLRYFVHGNDVCMRHTCERLSVLKNVVPCHACGADELYRNVTTQFVILRPPHVAEDAGAELVTNKESIRSVHRFGRRRGYRHQLALRSDLLDGAAVEYEVRSHVGSFVGGRHLDPGAPISPLPLLGCADDLGEVLHVAIFENVACHAHAHARDACFAVGRIAVDEDASLMFQEGETSAEVVLMDVSHLESNAGK